MPLCGFSVNRVGRGSASVVAEFYRMAVNKTMMRCPRVLFAHELAGGEAKCPQRV